MPKEMCKLWARSPSKLIEITYDWTIENFSLRKEKVVLSPTFSSPRDQGRKEWKLALYPNGDREEAKDHVDLFLRLVNALAADETVEVNYCLSIQDEQDNCLKSEKIKNRTFTNTGKTWGVTKVCKRCDLVDHLTNDVLKVTCQLSYLDAIHDNVSGSADITNQRALKCLLSDHLDHFMTSVNDQFSDVTICIGEEKTEFKGHRFILAARSPYFAAMFQNDFKEKFANRVVINDVKPEVFRDVISYIYTGNVPETMVTESVAKEVLIAADRFALEELKSVAENVLISQLNIENALELLHFSDTHSAQTLKTRANDFFAENVKQVMKTKGWKTKVLGHPQSHSLANEVNIEAAAEREHDDDVLILNDFTRVTRPTTKRQKAGATKDYSKKSKRR